MSASAPTIDPPFRRRHGPLGSYPVKTACQAATVGHPALYSGAHEAPRPPARLVLWVHRAAIGTGDDPRLRRRSGRASSRYRQRFLIPDVELIVRFTGHADIR
jgi:hypothetical protein